MATRRALLIAAAAAASGRAAAQPRAPDEVLAELPGAHLQGSGRMRHFGLLICDARLWTRPGFDAAGYQRQPLALELQYARSLDGRRIAEKSLDEMRQVGDVPSGKADGWLAEMAAAFPDVAKDDRITGVLRPRESARFFVNGTLRREVRDPDFADLFFGIWLSPRTSAPSLRRDLIGAAR
jgi:hypothetical protein